MDLVPAQLDALVAIADHGSFDAAARALQVTPSAVSQRVRALEAQVGQVVVERSSPCRPTPAGEVLVRLGRQQQLILDEAVDALSDRHRAAVDLPVAVNADSLATWFRDVVAEVAGWSGTALVLHVEDQAYSADLLRRGEVLAAVTSDPVAVQGCSAVPIGSMRYRPAATPAFAARWRRGRSHDWAAAPVVVFNDKDHLQADVLAARGLGAPPVVHRVPTSADYLEALRLGLGWGMLPDQQLRPDVAAGRLVALPGGDHLDVALHWQRWRLDSPVLDRLTAAVQHAAKGRVGAV